MYNMMMPPFNNDMDIKKELENIYNKLNEIETAIKNINKENNDKKGLYML